MMFAEFLMKPDVRAVQDIVRECFGADVADRFDCGAWLKRGGEFSVFWLEAMPVGFTMSLPAAEVVRLQTIAIRPAFQGRGFGSVILDRFSREHGQQLIQLQHSIDRRLAKFFGGLGYEVTGSSLVGDVVMMHRTRSQTTLEGSGV